MKKQITLLAAIAIVLTSCSKDWKCQVTSEYNGNVSTADFNFYGTTEEKNEYEEQNTFSNNIPNGGTVTTETVCYPD